MIIEGIVFRITPYKEKDAIVNVLTESGFITFSASGVLNINSKNGPSVTLYTHSQFELNERGSGIYYLKSGRVIASMSAIYGNLDAMAVLSIIIELTKNCYDEEKSCEIYQILLKIFEILKNKRISNDSLLLYYLAYSILNSGTSLNLNGCIYCGSKKQIVTIDYDNGGFVCGKCYKHNVVLHSKDYLLSLLKIFNTNILSDDLREIPNLSRSDLMEDLFRHLFDLAGIKIKSYELYKKIKGKR